MTTRARLLVSVFAALLIAPNFLFAHGGLRELKGTIARISPAAIVVTHTDGKTNESVALTNATTYKVGNAAGSFADMRVGSRVVVHFGHDGKALEVHLPSKNGS
jgi:hypothetical protein